MKKAILLLLLWICCLQQVLAKDRLQTNILLLHSYHPSLTWNIEINRGILEVIDIELTHYSLVAEYMDSKRLFDTIFQDHLKGLYKHKFAKSNFDVIILSDDDALRFMQKYGQEIFPDVPVVFCGVNVFDPQIIKDHPNFTGVLEKVDMEATLEVALDLFPNTTHVYFIGDRSTTAYDLSHEFRTNHAADYHHLNITYLHLNTLEAVSQATTEMPENAVILLWPFVSHEGNIIIEMEALPLTISANSNIPIFGFWHFNLNYGIVGGKLVSGYLQGKHAAEMAIKIINGEAVSNLPVLEESPNQFYFDYRRLMHYSISLKRLPQGSIIVNMPKTFLQKNPYIIRGFFVGSFVFLIFLAFFIYYNKKIKQLLKQELRFQQALMDALPNPVFYSFNNQTIEGCNQAFEKFSSLKKADIIGNPLPSIYPPPQLQHHLGINQEVMLTHKPAIYEGNVIGPRGEFKSAIFYKSAIFNKKTRKFGVIETIVDITDKKLAGEQIRLSEERYALATKATLDGIWDWNLSEQILFVSDRFKEILGYDKTEDPINHFNFEHHVHASDLTIFKHQFDKLILGEKESCAFEIRMRLKNNQWNWIEIKGFAVSESSHNPYRLVGSISDIQDRKEAEKALKKWEEIFRNTLMGIVIAYPESFTLDLINPVFAHMHGYRLEEISGKTFDTVILDDGVEKMRTALARAGKENHFVFESIHRRPDKTTFPVMVDITAVKNPAGKIIYYIINVQDISIRKKQERKITQMLQNEQRMNEDLRANEEELKQMLEQTLRFKEKLEENQNQLLSFINGTKDFALLKDRNQKYLMVNDAFARFYNKKPEEFIGKTDSELLPDNRATIFNVIDTKILKEGKGLIIEDFADGVYYETRKFPVFHGNQIIAIGAFIRNITEQKTAEQQIQANELRMKTLLENSVDLISLTDAKGIVTYCSDATESFTGLSSNEFVGKDILIVIHPEERTLWQQKFAEVLGNASKHIIVNHRMLNKKHGDMHLKTVMVNHLQNPAIRSIVITSHDISLEMQSQELQKNIIVAQKSAEIKHQFLANMSHEIRTPMNGIIGMIEFLQNTALDDTQKDYVETIKTSSDSLLNIINDILDFSKIEAGKLNISKTSVDIRKQMQDAFRLFTALTRQKNLEFSLLIDDNLPKYILLDPIRINQIISNLLSNAIKFTPAGKIYLKVLLEKAEDDKITIRFEVHDTGIGISKDNQDKLFQAFSQIDSSLTRSQEGTGLGLAICRKIVEQMGGEIGVKSTMGSGSVFWFRIDTIRLPHPSEGSELMDSDKPLTELNLDILLVEDKIVNQKVIKLMLESMGCQVTMAGNGQIALELIEKKTRERPGQPFDVILMDIQMPVMDGISATQIIRQRYPEQKIIIGLSANVLTGDIENFMQSGLTDYIVKPAKSTEIHQKLLFWKQNYPN